MRTGGGDSERLLDLVFDKLELVFGSHLVSFSVECEKVSMADHVTSVLTWFLFTLPDSVSGAQAEIAQSWQLEYGFGHA